MDVVEWLDQYRALYEYAMKCARRLDEARHQSLRSPSFDRGTKHSGTFTLDLPAAKIEVAEKRYRKAKEKLFSRLNELADMIDQLDEYGQKLVLMYRYILGMTWEQIAKKMPYSVKTIQRIHGRALKALDEILKNRKEETHDT